MIWYQGESNRNRAAQYTTLFPAMIESWRAGWNLGSFPFYFVQISPYGYGSSEETKHATTPKQLPYGIRRCPIQLPYDMLSAIAWKALYSILPDCQLLHSGRMTGLNKHYARQGLSDLI